MTGNSIFRMMNRIHIFVYRTSGGRILGKIAGSPVLLLTTTGRTTGKTRTVPLVYATDNTDYAVIASDYPAWHKNITSSGQATIEIRGVIHSVAARDAAGDEAEQWWAHIIAQSPAFQSFHSKPTHQIVILKPHSP